jgi:enoyl-[acyl-carrier protein] reductase II
MNRVLAHCGARYPIVQAPMGWIARSALASAVSRAGGLGIIETSSGETEACQAEILEMRDLGLPFGVNLPIRFLKDDAMLRFVCTSGVRFVTTSAGSPAKFIAPLHDAGIVVYHAVPTLDAALKGWWSRAAKAAASRTPRRCRRWCCCRRCASASTYR